MVVHSSSLELVNSFKQKMTARKNCADIGIGIVYLVFIIMNVFCYHHFALFKCLIFINWWGVCLIKKAVPACSALRIQTKPARQLSKTFLKHRKLYTSAGDILWLSLQNGCNLFCMLPFKLWNYYALKWQSRSFCCLSC